MENSKNYKSANCATNEAVRGVFEFNLNHLLRKRLGGSLNINGIVFQCKYALLKVLTFLNDSSNADSFQNSYIRLEGIEDIDLHTITLAGTTGDNYVQVKSTKQKLDASTFWNMKVLQNFLEAYSENKNSTFTLVHCTSFAKGHMLNLIKFVLHGQKMPSDTFEYWRTKIHAYLTEINISTDSIDILHFFQQLQFEKVSETELNHANEKAFIQNYDENNGNEKCYLTTLLWSMLDWSRERKLVSKKDIISVIENVKEDIAKGAINPAVQGRWIEAIRFQHTDPTQALGYFAGKAARPQHIAAGLPVRRSEWELKIVQNLDSADAFVIRASSGQGKSTLVWQTAHCLEQTGWSIYELLYCRDKSTIGSLLTYIESRIKIGEIPLIVIDGLSDSVSEWAELVSRAASLPVKFLITSREEDWYRYGMNSAEVRLEHISLSMSESEAEQIFNQFKKRNAIHSSINNWQSAWEKIRDRGLLMEFVCLITAGEMLEQRLSHQVRRLANEKNGVVKLDVLRLISVADVCGTKLETQKLINRIKEKNLNQYDLGECLRSIKDEFYVDLTDRRYVEGLHPVRSAYLMKRLHDTFPMGNTSKELLPLIESEYLSRYYSEVVHLLDDWEKDEFIIEAARLASEKNYSDIGEIVEGLFTADVLRHWYPNKQWYDHFFNNGLGLLSMEAFPWSGIKTFEDSASFLTGTAKENCERHLEIIRKITPFDPKQSTTYYFLRALSNGISKRVIDNDDSNLGKLWLWFIRFDLDCTLFNKITIDVLWHMFEELNMKELGFLFSAVHKSNPQLLDEFYSSYQAAIISDLKVRTNSITIKAVDRELLIQYFIEVNKQQDVNEESVQRIEAIMPILPPYQTYSTQVLWPPIPSLDLMFKYDPSIKHMPYENVVDSFKVYMNVLFRERIEQCYEELSIYEWQHRWFNLRRSTVELAKRLVTDLENILRNGRKNILPIAKYVGRLQEWERSLFPHRRFPSKVANVDVKLLQDKAYEVSTWIRSFQSIFAKADSIILPIKPEAAVLVFDLQQALNKLPNMKTAYGLIMEKTTKYFDVQDLEHEEDSWYQRLYMTIGYILNNQKVIGKTLTPEIDISIWWGRCERNRVQSIASFTSRLYDERGITCIAPSHTFKQENLRMAMIGINGASFSGNPELFLLVSIGLYELVELDIDVYIIVAVKDGKIDQPIGLPVTQMLLKEAIEMNNSNDIVEKFESITPWTLQSEWVKSLPNVHFEEPKRDEKSNAIILLLVALWEISEIRMRLSLQSSIESKWQFYLEKSRKEKVMVLLGYIRNQYRIQIYEEYETLVNRVLNHNYMLDKNQFHALVLRDIAK